jgi:ribosome-associated translation inhibitor RaiA
MQVQVHTDNNIEGRDELTGEVTSAVEQALERFADRLTRVEVHLKDTNSHKGGADDKHCTVEARAAGRDPVVGTHAAGTVDQAVDGAVKKVRAVLDRVLSKETDHKGRTPYGGEPGV